MKKPNFFIVGAPKCGTTAVSEYLKTHPNIFISDIKEPHFFAQDFWQFRPYYTTTEAAYLALFAPATAQHTAVGEASVWYLYSSVALQNIYQFDPHAKIIVMLRNPVDMIYSQHSQYCFSMVEDELDFEKAWHLQAARQQGQQLPAAARTTDRSAELFQYGQIGKLGQQMERLLNIFPESQLKVILYDDFKQDTRAVYQQLLAFLNVADDGRTDFNIINQNKVKKARWLAALSLKLKQVGKKVGIQNTGILQAIERRNVKQVIRQPMSPAMQQQLIAYFADDVQLLARLINRDLSPWLTAVAPKTTP